ncbi:hypothetical protein JHK82_016328 [Glycine max]|nr:hypothetical protein JHK85_016740 [Glycine max]KAG5149447.1 hypothetical protein JHK82_016328 [Glycine max]
MDIDEDLDLSDFDLDPANAEILEELSEDIKKRLASSFKLHYAAKEVTMAFGEGHIKRPVVLTCVSFLRPHVLVVLALTLTCKKINGTANMNAIRAASDQGCDSFSYLRRVSDRLLDENFGRQRYCTVNRAIGNPPKVYELDIDTGSYLTWTQCDASCKGCTLPCNRQYKPHGNLVKCVDPLCGAIQSALSLPHVTTNVQCDYQSRKGTLRPPSSLPLSLTHDVESRIATLRPSSSL